jgi:hypothetical protein
VLRVPIEAVKHGIEENVAPANSFERVLCPEFSAGKSCREADTFSHVQKKILAWFEEVAHSPEYCNPKFTPVKVEVNDAAQTDIFPGWANEQFP